MFFQKLSRRRNRTLAMENLSPRVVFSANPIAIDELPAEETIEVDVKPGTLGTVDLPDISLSFGTLEPGDYSFSFSIDINIAISNDAELETQPSTPVLLEPPVVVDSPLPLETPTLIEPTNVIDAAPIENTVVVVEPPSLPQLPEVVIAQPNLIVDTPLAPVPTAVIETPATADNNAAKQDPCDNLLTDRPPTDITQVGRELYIETFDSGQVADFWTEFTPYAKTEFIGPDGGDKELRITHANNYDSVVLRRELEPSESVYATFETTFESGFEQQEWWTLNQAALENVPGNLDLDGRVNLSVWGIKNPTNGNPSLSYVYETTGSGEAVEFDFPSAATPVRLSFFAEQNTPGQSDGRFMLWRDDELLIDDHKALLRKEHTAPSQISFIQGLSNLYFADPDPGLVRSFDDILFLTDPEVEPELVHSLALEHFSL